MGGIRMELFAASDRKVYPAGRINEATGTR